LQGTLGVMDETFTDSRQWGLPTQHIHSIPRSSVPPECITYNAITSPPTPLELSVAPSLIEPNALEAEPPVGYAYPKGRTLHRRDTNRYRARCVYAIPYHPPIDPTTEIDHLRRVILPPDSYPSETEFDHEAKEYRPKPMQGVTPLLPGVPVCVDLEGKADDCVTIAALFDLASLERYPEYEKIRECTMRLWDITWGKDELPPVYDMPGLQRNMRSGEVKEGRLFDGSSSQASTRLEGNGKGFGIPASQTDASTAYAVRSSFLPILSELYQLLAPLALSKEEYLVTTFRSVELNVYSFGGLFPTGLTSVQLNNSSGDEGGDLMAFIGAVQGSFHVDFHDDRGRWTMLVILIKLPPGSDPGAFILARFGLYAKLKLLPDGTCIVFLWFKGNDLHSGVAPTVHPSIRRAALSELAAQINQTKPINRVVYVCYPSEDLCHRTVPMMSYPTSLNSTAPSTNFHWYSKQGSPALGSNRDSRIRLWWDEIMESWNHAVSFGEKPEFPSGRKVREELNGEGVKESVLDEYPLPSFPLLDLGILCKNPYDDEDFFSLWRGLWKRHWDLSDKYYLSMTKFQYRFGQAQAKQEYEENRVDGVIVVSTLAKCAIEDPARPSSSLPPLNLASSYPALHRNQVKRKLSNPLISEHPAKQRRMDTSLSAQSGPDESCSPTATLFPSSSHVGSAPDTIDAAATTPPRRRYVHNSEGESEIGDSEDEEDDMEEELTVPLTDISFIVDSKVE
ncbi:hypothetical protein V5O48_018684, partial [Marasmius crinis-equi]